jgi:hypothetical protein
MNDMALNWTATEFSMACLLKHAGKILERMAEVRKACGLGAAWRFRNACINAFAQLDEEACYDDQSPLIDSLYEQLNTTKAV